MSPATRTSHEALEGERDFLLASLADLEREHAAGDVDEADDASLRADYVGRAAAVLRELEALETAPVPPPASERAPKEIGRFRAFRRFLGRRHVRQVLVAVGCCCVAGIATLVALRLAGVRLPGEQATGGVNVPTAELVRSELAQASELGNERQISAAITIYDTVLRQVPNQPEALTYRGWLLRLAGLQAHSVRAVTTGDAALAHAATAAPGYPDARGLYGLALLEDAHDRTCALVQFRAFAADRPSASLLSALGPQMGAAFTAAHATPPPLLARYTR